MHLLLLCYTTGMSKWTSQRKIKIIATFALLLGAIIIFFVVTNIDRTPTCFDGIQNGDETGVDCGGSCARICDVDARNIVVAWERPFEVTNNVYNVLAYFENQNISAGAARIPYRFRLYDERNIIVAEQSGETFIGPNQTSAIFEGGISTGNREPAYVFFEFLENPTWYTVDFRWTTPSLIVRDRVFDESRGSPRISATLENITLNTIFDIEVIAIAYDSQDNALHASRTRIDRLEGRSQAPLVFTWPEAFRSNVARIEIIPRINVFSDRNQ